MNKKTTKHAPKARAQRKPITEEGKPKRLSDLLAKALAAFEAKLKDKDFTPTLAEYIKLLQLEKEMDSEVPKEIRVRWIEPGAESAKDQ